MKVKEKYKSISTRAFPILKKRCIQCDSEFHFETGRKYITIDMFGPKEYYLCSECSSKGEKESDVIFETYRQKDKQKNRPKWPPPPTGGTGVYRGRAGVKEEIKNDYIKIIKEPK